MPPTVRLPGLVPPRAMPKITIQIGMLAMISAANPDGTSCMAQVIAPLPPSSNSAPMISALRQWMARGRGAPRSHIHVNSSAPAVMKRPPAMRKGGMVSIARLMAR